MGEASKGIAACDKDSIGSRETYDVGVSPWEDSRGTAGKVGESEGSTEADHIDATTRDFF